MDFKIIAFFIAWASLAAAQPLQIEAPQEIAEQIAAYSKEAGAQNENAILRINITKTKQCNNYALKLINKNNGKIIKETETCSSSFPNSVLQNSVFEIFGHPVKNADSGLSGNIKTILLGTGFAAAGILFYYSNPPKPVYGYGKISEEKK
jgi:hypothetical protein